MTIFSLVEAEVSVQGAQTGNIRFKSSNLREKYAIIIQCAVRVYLARQKFAEVKTKREMERKKVRMELGLYSRRSVGSASKGSRERWKNMSANVDANAKISKFQSVTKMDLGEWSE